MDISSNVYNNNITLAYLTGRKGGREGGRSK